ncbi:hypothetical protein QL285_052298 [Trifolium repens]|nr:hypothetical protein QL285_052298 [Trifolium repens]
MCVKAARHHRSSPAFLRRGLFRGVSRPVSVYFLRPFFLLLRFCKNMSFLRFLLNVVVTAALADRFWFSVSISAQICSSPPGSWWVTAAGGGYGFWSGLQDGAVFGLLGVGSGCLHASSFGGCSFLVFGVGV